MRITCTEELHESGGPGTFVLGRAEAVMDDLIREFAGKVQLIYLDPPFGTGDTFHVRLSQGKKSVTLPAFMDTMAPEQYVEWMRGILTGCHKLLSGTGALYLHIDYRMNAQMRLLLDEIFGESNFMNEIVWCYRSGGRSMRYFPRKHDTILFYRKSRNMVFDITAVGMPRGPERRNHMKRFVDDAGRVGFSIRSGGKVYRYYEDTPIYPTDVWTDIEHLQQRDKERTGYATQKPELLLKRIILASSRPGDLVCDLFSGSGTTASTAVKCDRRFLAVDASPFALYVLRARLLQNAAALSLFTGEHRMTLRYPAEEQEASIDYGFVEQNGREAVEIRQAFFELRYPLIYAALGRAEGQRFLPMRTVLQPVFPLTMKLGVLDHPVLHIVDALGRQAFYQLK